ncbi:DUF3558 domain-containing protein [Actinophytocola xanthii]|nr:DUF3558 domain-containing protein [Actinophytocola xanthii]
MNQRGSRAYLSLCATGRHLVAAAAVLLLALPSCAVGRAGGPVADSADGGTSGTSAPSNPVSAYPMPPRTRDLDLTGVDPCTDLLTDAQLRELVYDVGYQSRPGRSTSGIHGGPGCTFSSSTPLGREGRNISVLFNVATTEGAEVWLTDPARYASARLARPATVEGFPALVVPHPRFVDSCMAVVDTADDQYLLVASEPDHTNDTSSDRYCAEAERVATMAIQTLSATRR